MGLFDRFGGQQDSGDNEDPADGGRPDDTGDEETQEQLAPEDPVPRGEDRDAAGGFVFSSFGLGSSSVATPRQSVEASDPPARLGDDYDEYSEFPLVDAAMQIFADTVLEPGYKITAAIDGETDEDMEEALRMWARSCVIHAGATGQDLGVLLDRLVKRRRLTGTEFMEIAGTKQDPDAMAAFILHDPATFRQFARADQSVLIRPDDEVDGDHPTAPSGDAAAYVQYHESLQQAFDHDPIAFSQRDMIKFVYNADPGDLWGRSLFTQIGGRIDSLRQKWDDRDAAIHQTGHPHRIYSSDSWSQEEAKTFISGHKEGEYTRWEVEDGGENDRYAGRIDAVPATVEITTESGDVADISDAVMDDIQSIFSVLPVSQFKIAYSSDINQFVVEPQSRKDDLLIDQEREYLRRKFEPLFQEKADELAGGNYRGDVDFSVEPAEDDNPLRRESFPRENLQALGSFLDSYSGSSASQDIPLGAILDMAGMDLDEMRDEFGFEPDELGQTVVDEETPAGQEQQDAIDEAPDAGEAPPAAETDDDEGDDGE